MHMQDYFTEDTITLGDANQAPEKTMTLKNIISALISAVLVAILGYIVTLTDISQINLHQVLNIAVFTFAASLLKVLLTTKDGNFIGLISIK